MKIKAFICSIALGAMAFASCDKPEPEQSGKPQPDAKPEPEIEVVEFSNLKASNENQVLTISGVTANFTFVDQETTPVSVWYTTAGDQEKKSADAIFDQTTSTISGSINDVPYGDCTIGVSAKQDDQIYHSEGIAYRLVAPPVYSDIKAEVKSKKISATGKVSDFTFVDYETTPVGLWWYLNEETRGEAKGTYDPETGTVSAITGKELELGEYKVGIFVRKEDKKFHSVEFVTVKVEKEPGFHIPDFNENDF